MITVLLQGRTGNNLFQYAAGRFLASARATRLKLEASWMPERDAAQARQLLRLPLKADFVRRAPRVKRALRKIPGITPAKLHRGHVFREPAGAPGFIGSLSELPDGTLLDGFFQCSGYAAQMEAQLREELDLSVVHLPPTAVRFMGEIEGSNSVSLHVRRGDYLSIPGTQCLTDDYHERAIQHLARHHEQLRFFIFSDDPSWCRSRFMGPQFTHMEVPGSAEDPFIDLRLMAACKHHVIVNSSYSWWGAWLNPSASKEVIAPKLWMAKLPGSKILPTSWLTI